MTGDSLGPLDVLGAITLAGMTLGFAWVLLCYATDVIQNAVYRVTNRRRRSRRLHPATTARAAQAARDWESGMYGAEDDPWRNAR